MIWPRSFPAFVNALPFVDAYIAFSDSVYAVHADVVDHHGSSTSAAK